MDPANKGALLMLESAVIALRERFPEARLVASWSFPTTVRERFELGRIRPRARMRRSFEFAWKAIPDGVQELLNVTPRRRVDAVLDISGFAYGDFWPVQKIEDRLLSPIAERNGQRPKLILLPQAFGPFEDRAKADAMRRAIAGVDLLFARDKVSYDHIRRLAPAGESRVRQAPDFTNLLDVGAVVTSAETAYVIPNAKVPASAGPSGPDAYHRFLATAIARLRDHFSNVALLIHEGDRDVHLAEALNRTLADPAPVVIPETARDTKRLIAGAACVVSSRFHGLVSALSCGVPALACGWTHKYGELMRDYGLGTMLVDPERPEDWEEKLAELAAMARSDREPLLLRAGDWKASTRAMWDEVFDCIAPRQTQA